MRLTRDLVQLMEERTGDGYVFRTDLRLRPDPGATQLALSTDAALIYYESFGQNWERAALIKARPCAGDLEAGRQLIEELAPFIWRKYLDFAAIADVHAMKRQIHAHRGFEYIAVAGHNIKLGRGGIREIEFFVQTQQLIAGGRQPDLRVPQTLEALQGLAARGWIKEQVARDLAEAYVFLRRIEHRLQMVADEQTHEIPDDPGRLFSFALFCGYPDVDTFARELTRRLETVQRHYAALFEDSPELTAGGVNMVFAGEKDDPATVAALKEMGYERPEQVLANGARLASRSLCGGALGAGARAPDRGAAAAHRRARRYHRPRPGARQLRPLHGRVADRRAVVLAACAQTRACCGCWPTSWEPRRGLRASSRAAAACSTPCSIRACWATYRRPRSSTV